MVTKDGGEKGKVTTHRVCHNTLCLVFEVRGEL